MSAFEAPLTALGTVILRFGQLAGILLACYHAYDIRMHAIREYGPIIHEFDPWFNMRATTYLYENGWNAFFTWFDHRSWYPLGRPVGSTIYPGMQISAVVIEYILRVVGYPMSLNDVCCYIPCWFGVSASLFTGLFTYETSKSVNAGVVSALIMAVIPAHTMRSVGGGFDNEAVAVTCMVGTFYFWVRSLRDDDSWIWGIATGLMYFYMVAAWGGYIFIINMISLHVVVLIGMGKYSEKLFRAFTLYYVLGTFLAIRVPVVGWAPLKSLEQLAGLGVFILLILIKICENNRMALIASDPQNRRWQKGAVDFYVKVFTTAAAAGFVGCAVLFNMGYFGPWSSRIRGLFVAHTRTGNPLVDSVSEHQPSSVEAYIQYLNITLYLFPFGALLSFVRRTDADIFLVSYALVAYMFSAKMARLIILMGPMCSATTGVLAGFLLDLAIDQAKLPLEMLFGEEKEEESEKEKEESKVAESTEEKLKKLPNKPKKTNSDVVTMFIAGYNHPASKPLRLVFAVLVLPVFYSLWGPFLSYSEDIAIRMSHPTIVFKAQLTTGETIQVNDYIDSYLWLKKNTPEDARIMSWWDYGYQISGIGERTTLADGNTWNHEHIALIARCLTGEEKESHQLIRHLADYVLVWAGGGGDDMAKSPHLARIGNSVYDDICPGDPTCATFGRDASGRPTPFMARSVLFKLHSSGKGGVTVDTNRFREVYQSKFGKVRIYKVMGVSQESKAWAADPANRICDAPGSWYCVGQYPPAIGEIFKKKGVEKRDFAQLEDFNTGKAKDARAKKYQEEYHAAMEGRPIPKRSGGEKKKGKKKDKKKKLEL